SYSTLRGSAFANDRPNILSAKYVSVHSTTDATTIRKVSVNARGGPTAAIVPTAMIAGMTSATASDTRFAADANRFCPSASTPVFTAGPSRIQLGNNTAVPFWMVSRV